MNYKKAIAELIKIEGVSADEIENYITVPPNAEMGDFSLPCFRFSKILKKAPPAISDGLSRTLVLPSFIARVESVNGYLNFFLNRESFSAETLEKILSKGSLYGDSGLGNGKTVCIDYSSINIAKPFHIGHLSTTAIGAALYRIYKKLGYNTVGINHLGDWGTQFGKLIVAYKNWGNKDEINKNGIKALLEIYVRFHAEAEKNGALEDEARAWFKKIEDGDKEAAELFGWFKELTLKEVDKLYERLNIKFDSYAGESFYNDKMAPVIARLKAQNLISESNGAKVVRLDDYDMPPCLITKADGASLYATRDLAAAFYRKKEYDFYKCLYVVAYQQNLHFKQWFKVVELMGEPWAKDLVHVAFGMVSLEGATLSTRKGQVVFLDDVINKAVEKAFEIINEKSPGLPDKQATAEQIGVGAVLFSALVNGRIKDIVFSYDKVLSFEGETAPYIQYTFARANSITERVEKGEKTDFDGLNNPEAAELLTELSRFPDVLKESAEKYEPCFLTRNLLAISRAFNKFYIEHRILGAEEGIKNSRLMLTEATKTVLKEGLRLLGIAAPSHM